MAEGILCQSCGIEAPARYVEFNQNIGMLIRRRYEKFKGNLCKRCLHQKFWKMSGTTLFLGPWGRISLFISPIYIVANTFYYLRSLAMPPVPPDAKVPVLDDAAARKVAPYASEIARRLSQNEPMVDIYRAIARQAKVTPGQVLKYVAAASRQPTATSVAPPRSPQQQAPPPGPIPLQAESGEAF